MYKGNISFEISLNIFEGLFVYIQDIS